MSASPTAPYFEINGYQARAQIGCAPDEHGVAQGVVIDLRVHLFFNPALYLDRYAMPYDYMAAVDAIATTLAEGHHILQESLALKIGRRVLASEHVERVDVRVRKTERYDGVESIGFFTPVDRDLLMKVDATARTLA
ncbi:dihydroneopterin aldolase [Sphaerotilus montanus]|uniref:dihydroneopterin aldolase n=1 Tax=Sphaerotilus montanus TaxID=522889 RepID=UPI003FA335E2